MFVAGPRPSSSIRITSTSSRCLPWLCLDASSPPHPKPQQQYQRPKVMPARHRLIPNLTKPIRWTMHVRESQENDKLSMAHSAWGDRHPHQKYEDARTELMLATTLASAPDPVTITCWATRTCKPVTKRCRGCLREVRCEWPVGHQCKSRGDPPKKMPRQNGQVALCDRSGRA